MGISELKRTSRPRSGTPWDGERVDPRKLEMESFLAARINRLARLLNKPTARAYILASGISMLEWRLLANLSQISPCLARDLSARMAIDKASVSRVLQRLHKRKLIAIRGSNDDARASIITILPAGTRMYQAMLPSARERQAALLNVLTAAERRVLWEALAKLTRAAEDITRSESLLDADPDAQNPDA